MFQRLLLHKLKPYKFHECVTKWLLERNSVVMVNEKCSKSCNITYGVPQGSLRILFIPIIHDIPLYEWNSHCMLYEDGPLFGMDATDCGEPELQQNADTLHD